MFRLPRGRGRGRRRGLSASPCAVRRARSGAWSARRRRGARCRRGRPGGPGPRRWGSGSAAVAGAPRPAGCSGQVLVPSSGSKSGSGCSSSLIVCTRSSRSGTRRGRRPRAGRGWRGPGRWSGRRPRPPRSCCRDPLSGRPGVLGRPGPPPESTHVSVFTPKPCGCLRSAGMPRGLNRSTSMCMDSGGCDLRSTIRWGSWRRVTGAGVSAWLTSGRRAGVADDEHGRVVADKAPVAVLGGERDRAPRVARGLRGVPGSDHGGEADRDVGAPAPPLEGPGARGAVDGRPPRAVRLEAAEGGGPLACTTRSGLRSRSKRLNLPQEAVVLRGRWSPGADRTLVGCRRPGAPAGRSAGDGRHRAGP